MKQTLEFLTPEELKALPEAPDGAPIFFVGYGFVNGRGRMYRMQPFFTSPSPMPESSEDFGLPGQFAIDGDRIAFYVPGIGWRFADLYKVEA